MMPRFGHPNQDRRIQQEKHLGPGYYNSSTLTKTNSKKKIITVKSKKDERCTYITESQAASMKTPGIYTYQDTRK